MRELQIKIVSRSGYVPSYETEGSAGADLRAWLPDGPVTLQPGERRLVPTGLFVELPPGIEAQIRARSGLSIKHGITMINGVGTVDSDYRGEWNVPLVSPRWCWHDMSRLNSVWLKKSMKQNGGPEASVIPG